MSAGDESIQQLRAAIRRTEDALSDMSIAAQARGVCPCCVGASYGGAAGLYDQLSAKLERQEAWLSVRLAQRGEGEMASASRNYQDVLKRCSRMTKPAGER